MKLPYELYTQQRIVDHLENHSPTKFMYSFSRAQRFPSVDRRGFSDSFYVFPGLSIGRTGQKVGIGYGTKYDFTKSRVRTEIVGIKRDFDIGNKPRGVSYTFGESRAKFGKVCTPGNKIIDKNVPGPGKYYSIINTLGNMGSPKYSLRPKCGEFNTMNKTMNNPGPGTYEPVVKINPNGKYPISRCPNTKGRNFGIDNIQRFNNYRYNNIPGPNAYKTTALTGHHIFNSKFKSPCFYSCSQKLNIPNRNERYPGPGSYIRFSEFGVLDPNYKKRRIETEPSKRTEEIKNEETKEDKDEQYPNEDEKVKQNENTHKQEEKIKQSERVENDEEKNKNIQNEPIQEENPNPNGFDNNVNEEEKKELVAEN